MSGPKVTPEEFERLTQSMQEFPLVYPTSQQFISDGQPSGARNATANATVSLANAPHLLVGIRLWNTYTPPGADATEVLTRKGLIKAAGIDEEQSVRLSIAQQNLTVGFVLQPLLVGAQGINWHPFVIPFGFRGNNQLLVEVRRETAYPIFGTEQVLPTVHIALITTQFVSDFAPATAPGSTGRP